MQKYKRVLSRSEDVSLPVKSSGCSKVQTLSFVLRHHHMYRRTHATSVVLCEVSADASDQRGDEVGQAGELSGEEGVAVLRLRRHRSEVIQGSPGHAHREHGDAWWFEGDTGFRRNQHKLSFLYLNTHLVSVQQLPGA